ncbi:Homeobox-leucine zipper protein ROC1, partial [Cucurbita argyrosperma subsp. sororia]
MRVKRRATSDVTRGQECSSSGNPDWKNHIWKPTVHKAEHVHRILRDLLQEIQGSRDCEGKILMDNNYPQYNEGAGSSHTSNSPQCASNFNIFDQSASNSNSNVKGNELHRASDLLMAVSVCTEANFSRIADLADTAMDELIKAALDGDPIWMPQQNEEAESYYTLLDIMKMVEWDILSFGYVITELACIINGNDSRNRVSIIQVNSSPRKVEIFYLQESYFDATGSYIVYAPVDLFAMSILLRGGNPDNVAILSSGFVVLPDNLKMNGQEVEADSSIVTVALNIVDHSITERIPFDSMVSMHRIMNETVASIKQAFQVSSLFLVECGGKTLRNFLCESVEFDYSYKVQYLNFSTATLTTLRRAKLDELQV